MKRFFLKYGLASLLLAFPFLVKAQFAKQTILSPLEIVRQNQEGIKSSVLIPIPIRKIPGINPIKYTAFFCKMEQKSINKLGVCLQFHAGRYNDYYKGKRYLED